MNVHEGPNGISKYRTEVLTDGNIVSNGKLNLYDYCFLEPGYYLEGKFGIRIENLVLVK